MVDRRHPADAGSWSAYGSAAWCGSSRRAKQNPVYTDFEDELSEATLVELPGITPGTNWERFRAKAAAYLKQHEDHVALQRLRRNKHSPPTTSQALEQMLLDSGAGDAVDIDRAKEESGGLGLFIRSLVGLDREAAIEAFGTYLDGTKFTADQVRFVNLIVDELTANGVMEPARLFESPYTDHAPTGPESVFPEADVDVIVDILNTVKANACRPMAQHEAVPEASRTPVRRDTSRL